MLVLKSKLGVKNQTSQQLPMHKHLHPGFQCIGGSYYKNAIRKKRIKNMKKTWYPGKWKALCEVQHMQRSQLAHTQKLRCSSATNYLVIWGTFWILEEYKSITAGCLLLPPFTSNMMLRGQTVPPPPRGCFPFTAMGSWWHHITSSSLRSASPPVAELGVR